MRWKCTKCNKDAGPVEYVNTLFKGRFARCPFCKIITWQVPVEKEKIGD